MPKPLTPPDDELGIYVPVSFTMRATYIFYSCFLNGPPAIRFPTLVFLFILDYVLRNYVLHLVSYV
jgi:hypothetical protein